MGATKAIISLVIFVAVMILIWNLPEMLGLDITLENALSGPWSVGIIMSLIMIVMTNLLMLFWKMNIEYVTKGMSGSQYNPGDGMKHYNEEYTAGIQLWLRLIFPIIVGVASTALVWIIDKIARP